MAYTTQYTGSRYIPVFADPAEWNSTRTYEPLTVVLNKGNSYTSRQFVPVGIDITNENYWLETGNYNAQVEQYRQNVLSFISQISSTTNIYDTMAEAKNANLAVGKSFFIRNFNNNDGYIGFYTITDTNNSKCILYSSNTYAQIEAINGLVRPENFFGTFANATDDTNFQYVLNSGYTNFLLEGTYKIYSALSLPDKVNFIGTNTNLRTSKNTIFQIMNSTAQLILPNTSVIKGIRFEYPNRVYNDTTYVASIYISNNDAKTNISDITFINGNIGIDMNNVNQVNIDGVYGWCASTMIHTYNRWEHSVINNITMTPWALSELISAGTIIAYDLFYYSYLNSTVLNIDTHTDWLSCSNVFGFSVKTVLRTNITGGDFENIGADGCNLPIWIQRSNTSTTQLSINNLMLTNALSGNLIGKIAYQNNPLILIDNEPNLNTPDIYINISNVNVWGTPYEFLRMNKHNANVNISNVNIVKGTTQSFIDKPGTDPLIFINSNGNNNINISNVNIKANAMDYLITGTTLVNDITINGLYALLRAQNNQPHLIPTNFYSNYATFINVRLQYNGYTPSGIYDFMNAPSTGRYIGSILVSGIPQSYITFSFGTNAVAYLLGNETLYKSNIGEARG